MNTQNLQDLNQQARCVLMTVAETGAGLSEQVGLLPEDIILDHEIPHNRHFATIKEATQNEYRKRVIPLVGYALEAFKLRPKGFTDVMIDQTLYRLYCEISE